MLESGMDPVEVVRQLRAMGAREVRLGDLHVVFDAPVMPEPSRRAADVIPITSQEDRYVLEAIRGAV